MRSRFKAAAVAAAMLVLLACQAKIAYQKYETEEAVPRIAMADAKKDFDAGNAVFVDSRAEDAYKTEHIKGSINVPFGSQEAMMDKIPKGKKIIIYCS